LTFPFFSGILYVLKVREKENMKDKKQTVRIEPTNEASKRTKNRIRERGPIFQRDRIHLDGNSWLMRQTVSNGCTTFPHQHGEIWVGWLPVNEFKVIEKVNR
jgi:hypothetical protein